MEKREISILFVMILGALLIYSLGMTGNVINETMDFTEECNIADFNADGIVNYLDKVKFNRIYEANLKTENYCGLGDLNEDGRVNELDSNAYAVIFTENYGVNTGLCDLRTLHCEDKVITSSAPPMPEIQEMPTQKPNFFQTLKTFFKDLF